MRSVTHREMRNQSGEILRLVAAGETIQVTNGGQVAALIVPASTDPMAQIIARGEVRPASRPPSALASLRRGCASVSTREILADSRTSW